MARGEPGTIGRNRAAAVHMVAGLGFLSISPLLIAWSGASDAPFQFNAGWRCGVAVGSAVFLVLTAWRLFFDRQFVGLVKRRLFSWLIVIATIGTFDYGLFTLSWRFVDISVTTVSYAVWPIFIILLIARLMRDRSRYQAITPTTFLMLLVGLIGFGFIAVSQSGSFGDWNDVGALWVVLGIVLAILAALTTSLASFSFRWSSNLFAELRDDGRIRDRGAVELACLVLAYGVSNLVSAPVNFAIGMVSGETVSVATFAFGVLGGAVLQTSGSILWRRANLLTDNLGINALVYGLPIFSLWWLFMFDQAGVVRLDYFVMGAAAIIVANLLINMEAEIGWGFKSLVLALGTSGAIVYLRDAFWEHWDFGGWIWSGQASYFEALGLSATIFTLLFAFRVARLVTRARDEDNKAFALFRELDELCERGVVSAAVRQHILVIDATQGVELERAYQGAVQLIAAALARATDGEDRRRLVAMQSELDALAHSRQQGINFGEFFALYAFAGLTVFLSLATRPNVSGLSGLLVELFAMLFTAVIVFLAVNVWDLERSRRRAVLRAMSKGRWPGAKSVENDQVSSWPGWTGAAVVVPGAGGYLVHFQDTKDRMWEQIVSLSVALGLAVAYAALLSHKWLAQ